MGPRVTDQTMRRLSPKRLLSCPLTTRSRRSPAAKTSTNCFRTKMTWVTRRRRLLARTIKLLCRKLPTSPRRSLRSSSRAKPCSSPIHPWRRSSSLPSSRAWSNRCCSPSLLWTSSPPLQQRKPRSQVRPRPLRPPLVAPQPVLPRSCLRTPSPASATPHLLSPPVPPQLTRGNCSLPPPVLPQLPIHSRNTSSLLWQLAAGT